MTALESTFLNVSTFYRALLREQHSLPNLVDFVRKYRPNNMAGKFRDKSNEAGGRLLLYWLISLQPYSEGIYFYSFVSPEVGALVTPLFSSLLTVFY